jgi:hypothetical protein
MRSELFFTILLLMFSCKLSQKVVAEKNENALVLSMERTACYGRCPVFDVKIFESGLLIYNGKQFVKDTGCFRVQLTQKEVLAVQTQFDKSIFSFNDNYPEKNVFVTDLPTCILYYKSAKGEKRITDRRSQTPIELTKLEETIDMLIASKKLQKCDK